MLFSRPVRRVLGEVCNTLGVIWAAAGLLKLVFGVQITFPLFPPLDLTRVAPLDALGVAFVLVTCGAWLRRSARTVEDADDIAARWADRVPPSVGEGNPYTVPADVQANQAAEAGAAQRRA